MFIVSVSPPLLDAGELEVGEAVHGGGADVGEVVVGLEGVGLFAALSHNPSASRRCMAEFPLKPDVNVHWIL